MAKILLKGFRIPNLGYHYRPIPGFVYYLYFPEVNVLKIGKTIRGTQRFFDRDYMKTYNYYGWMNELILQKVEDMETTEKILLDCYKNQNFKNISRKTEFFRCEQADKPRAEYIFETVISVVENERYISAEYEVNKWRN
jgi:hypothetical protein